MRFVPPPEVKPPLPTQTNIPKEDPALRNQEDKLRDARRGSTARRRKKTSESVRAPTILNSEGK